MIKPDPRLSRNHTSLLRGRVCTLLAVTASGFALACSPVLGTLGAAASPGSQAHPAIAIAAKKKCKKNQVLRHNRCVRKVGRGY